MLTTLCVRHITPSENLKSLSLEQAIWALLNRRALFVLGAGASIPWVPLLSGIASAVDQSYLGAGSFPVTPSLNSEPRTQLLFRDRLSKGFAGRMPELSDELLGTMSPGFVQQKVRSIIRTKGMTGTPDNYAVFQHFPATLIVNFNLDGFAERICRPRHIVASNHGQIPAIYGTPFAQELIAFAQEFQSNDELSSDTLFTPEGAEFRPAFPLSLRLFDFVAVIGCSFGAGFRGRDDAASYARLVSLTQRYLTPVLFFDPNSSELAGEFAEDAKSSRVSAVSVYWNLVSSALVTGVSLGASPNYIARLYHDIANKH